MKKTRGADNFYLGKLFDLNEKKTITEAVPFESNFLTTHAICVGMTGSGKTGLGIDLLEEIGLRGIPAIIVDPKGDLTNLLLTFPDLAPNDFYPWIDPEQAVRNNLTREQLAEETAAKWEKGLESWDIGKERIKKLKDAIDMSIYTPASQAGISVSILNSFNAPPKELIEDKESFRDLILSTTSSILGLIGVNADPVKSREHILISTILEKAWGEGKDLSLPQIINQILNPPFEEVGVFNIETFYPKKDRQGLSIQLNNLLASPSFQSWLQGEPLEIQNILYTKENKPKFSIFTISHLSDSEKMFFVTLLLNTFSGWIRRQTGSSDLKAVLYMDEIFGFFPPVAAPPSKRPMITLLKQSRAFGIGVILATQNPVDLDYRGLANCGTWFIGKLQTERDRKKVLDGLSLASNGELDADQLKDWLSNCGSRVFVLRTIHQPLPSLFQTRWTMSYLKGPLTLPQIEILMKNKKGELSPVLVNGNAPPIKIALPSDIQERYYKAGSANQLMRAELLGLAKVHFIDSKKKLDTWRSIAFSIPVRDDAPLWAEGKSILENEIEKKPSAEKGYEPLPAVLAQEKNYPGFIKNFAEYLYQNQTLDLFEAPELKQISREEEDEDQFRNRLALEMKEKNDSETNKIKEKYRAKIEALQEKLRKNQIKIENQKSKTLWKIWDVMLSFLNTALGVIFGKRKLSKGSINQAGTSLRRMGRLTKEKQSEAQAAGTSEEIQKQINELEQQMNAEIDQAFAKSDPKNIKIEKLSIPIRKSDTDIEMMGILWI